jgi:hypothetical protein
LASCLLLSLLLGLASCILLLLGLLLGLAPFMLLLRVLFLLLKCKRKVSVPGNVRSPRCLGCVSLLLPWCVSALSLPW